MKQEGVGRVWVDDGRRWKGRRTGGDRRLEGRLRGRRREEGVDEEGARTRGVRCRHDDTAADADDDRRRQATQDLQLILTSASCYSDHATRLPPSLSQSEPVT